MPIHRFFAALALLGATSCLTNADTERNAQKATLRGRFQIEWHGLCLVPWGSYVSVGHCGSGQHQWYASDTGLSVMLRPAGYREYLTSGGGEPGYWLPLDLPEAVLESRADQQWVFEYMRLRNLDTGLCAEVGSDAVLTQHYCDAANENQVFGVLQLGVDAGGAVLPGPPL
jgi:hypothetical protein